MNKNLSIKDLCVKDFSINISLNGVFLAEVVCIDRSKLTDTLNRVKRGFSESDGYELSIIGNPYTSKFILGTSQIQEIELGKVG